MFLRNTRKRVNLVYGGAGSGKSWAVAQYLLFEKFSKEKNIAILIVRKTLPSLKTSCVELIRSLCSTYNITHSMNKTDLVMRRGSNYIVFRSLDDIEKIKSIEGINYVWVEEATEITWNDFLQLNLRPRHQNRNGDSINQLFYTFNPVDVSSFLKPLTEVPPLNIAINHSTFRDNAFLDVEYVKHLEGLISQDHTYYLIYNKGQWASPGNVIYTNWVIVPAWPDSATFDTIGYGLDFGYNHPTALIEIGMRDGAVWERELLYHSKMTNAQLISKLQTLIPLAHRTREILADSAEPARIEEIYKAGFNVHPAEKGPGSIGVGIDRVQRYRVSVLASSTNLIKEKRTYKWRVDKNNNIMDEPVDFNNHLLDAERYYLGREQPEETQLIEVGAYDFGQYTSMSLEGAVA